ncbi:hypothetical protein M426DRAFT_322585 [Hypoxylon sp. CI-4A]|nr:hypothetical protein M426DRAFT_322585 [Hypoxylon sp. CI-4A]
MDNLTTTAYESLANRLDVVATQGAYLVPRVGTPVFEKAYDVGFSVELTRQLNALLVRETCRNVMYHGAADEWPIGRTPPELKEKRQAELKALEELEYITSGNEVEITDEDSEAVSRSLENRLPTPPQSTDSPTILGERKRDNMPGMNDSEMRFTTISSIPEGSLVSNALSDNVRKRKSAPDMREEHPAKACRKKRPGI